MARLARVEVFAADEIAMVHVMNRTVRRCFLPGDDAFSGRSFNHRQVWLVEQLIHQARYRADRLLDETAILTCAAYADLNPIRAALAETIEESDFTSAQRRFSVFGFRFSVFGERRQRRRFGT